MMDESAMEKAVNPVSVEILGKSYTVACPAGEELFLRDSARRVDAEMRKIRDSGKIIGSERIAVVVALNLASDLLQSRRSEVSDGSPNAARVHKLTRDIEAVLESYQSGG